MNNSFQVFKCANCGHATALPLDGCPACGSTGLVAVESARTGRLYTWTTTHHVFDSEGGADVPYTVGMVTLDDGARVPARIVGVEPGELRADLGLRRVDDEERLTFAVEPG